MSCAQRLERVLAIEIGSHLAMEFAGHPIATAPAPDWLPRDPIFYAAGSRYS